MKTWKQIIDDTHVQMKERKWNTIYWSIDLHDTVITGEYNKFNHGSTLLPGAKKVLDYLHTHRRIDVNGEFTRIYKTILWTSSYIEAATDAVKLFDLKFDYFNENPECLSGDLCDFSGKFYFNVLIDDKSGFDGKVDWEEIYQSLSENK